jgi:phospholipid/cholesterol/gamma-HCH transport system permease protein
VIGVVPRVGRATIAVCTEVGAMTLLVAAAVGAVLRGRVDARELVRHLHRFAVEPLLLVLGGAVITGGVVAMQGLDYVRRYNAGEVLGWAAGLSSFRDVGPLLLGFTLSARLGARNTAELSTMVARERLDALRALGLDPREVVVLPRLIAVSLAGVVLYPIGTTTVLLTSFGVAQLVGDQRFSTSWWSFVEYVQPGSILQGLLRLVAFSTLIGVTSCHFGAQPGSDAASIGRAVFASSVASMGGIVVVNLYLSFAQGTS